MAKDWPYLSIEELLAASERAFDALSRDDWLQAFAAHARIGAPKDGDAQGAAEQAGVAAAADTELAELARLNAEYEQRFGHVFLICATGLSSGEMLAALRERIVNPAAAEFDNARREQRKITALRLRGPASPHGDLPMTAISTHVLDLARGIPASGVAVELHTGPFRAPTPPPPTTAAPSTVAAITPWQLLSSATTDADGRATGMAGAAGVAPGLCRLVFATGPYERARGAEPFIEEAAITFTVSGEARLHIPLLLSPFGLSIYRGS